jgi:alanyl-tRNA synthetase
MPSNEGRGYVLRRIIRRAIRHGNKLGANDLFFHLLVKTLVQEMGQAFPELAQKQAIVEKILRIEEVQFAKTLERGLALLESSLADLQGTEIPGELVFKLYDTYGFPADLTADIAREKELTINEEAFASEMAAQRKMSQAASGFGADYNDQVKSEHESIFKGYDNLEYSATVVELFKNGESVTELSDGDEGIVILDNTPFYAESGGQSGDHGVLDNDVAQFTVTDTQKVGNAIGHYGKIIGSLTVNARVNAQIDSARRDAIKQNHSATHLLHAALRKVLGEHVGQKGSLVEADKFRFDFSHYEGVTAEQLQQAERLVNEQIQQNHDLTTDLMQIDAAKEKGAMALFGEKYDDEVRVVSMGPFSIELCGGTHVSRTGDIGLCKIISEAGIAAGIRRVEAVTGMAAIEYLHQTDNTVNTVASLLKGEASSLVEKVEQTLSRNKTLERELRQLKEKMASQQGSDLTKQVTEIAGVKCLIANLESVDPKSLRGMIDELKNKLGSVVIMLAAVNDDKVSLIAGVTKDLIGKVKAGDLVNHVASQVGGKGGGRPDMAQAGGTQPENVDTALASVSAFLTEKLS